MRAASKDGGFRRRAARVRLCLAAGLAFTSAPSTAEPAAPDDQTLAALAGASASADVRRLASWILTSGDTGTLPFVIIDKVDARVFAFAPGGRLRGASPALLGMARGDRSPVGIGTRRLSQIMPAERITPSGRFVARLGPDLGAKDVLWVDYDAAISLHRVFTGTPSEHRLARLATPSTADNRISYGCINVPVSFYETVVHPLFVGTRGIVYVLPEVRPLLETFPGVALSAAPSVFAAR